MDALLTIIICVVLVNIIAYLLKKIYIPHVISLLLMGLFFGLPQIRNTLLEPNTNIILILGDLGILFLMFIAGLNSSKELLNSEKYDSLIISMFSAVFPFILSLSIFMLLGFTLTSSLIIAICMGITAEATNMEVLISLKKLRTKVGSIIMEAGIIDDVLGVFVFFIIQFIMREASVKDDIFLIAILAAFFLGILFQRLREFQFTQTVEQIALYVIIPFFFISIGLHFDFSVMILNPLLLILIISLGILGKLGGTVLTIKFVSLKKSQLYLIGWAMNSRGAVDLVLAFMAFRSGFITHEIYSALLLMILITTLIFPFVISFMISKQPKIMSS